jgi:hypothetical protein
MRSLYVIGGQQRSSRPLFADDRQWYEYQKGLILQADLDSGAAAQVLEYISPAEARGAEDPILFKCATFHDDRLYACTQTEVLIYALPSFERVGYISLPCFNDVHHVRPTPAGNLLVVNTGLEMILEITPSGEIVREWNVLGEDPWERFSRQIDYRKGVSTKPRRAHPNYVFYIGEEIWITRFEQRDAICLADPSRRIEIGGRRVHDGVLHNGLLYFTQVEGNVVVAHPHTLKVEEVIDLNAIAGTDTLLGWCRGLMFDGSRAWVGFTRIRPTKFREAVSWVRQGFQRVMPSHIACYELERRRCVAEIDVELPGLNAVFSIVPGRDSAEQAESAKPSQAHVPNLSLRQGAEAIQ